MDLDRHGLSLSSQRAPRASAALAGLGFACYNAVRYQFKNKEKTGEFACFHAAPR
jgi:hypothetical protein